MDLGGSIVPSTGSIKHLRRRLVIAGAALMVAAAGIVTTGLVIYLDDGGSSATIQQSVVAQPRGIDEIENPPFFPPSSRTCPSPSPTTTHNGQSRYPRYLLPCAS